MSLLKDLRIKGKILYKEPLYRHTTFGLGGPVDIWVEPEGLDDIRGLLEIASAQALPVFLIGKGSNLLIPDEGLRGTALYLGDFFQAGQGLQRFILDTIGAGYTGLEFMAGIPGNVGGAVRMNAGAGLNGPWLSDFVDKVKVCDYSGKVRWIEKKAIRFGYRESNLKDFIILEVEFNLKRSMGIEASKKEYKRFLNEKKAKQELTMPSAGCVFKNPVGGAQCAPLPSAAQLIEGCGLKAKRIGDAMVSCKHANFIVNMGKARFKDVIELIELIKDEVLKRYGIALETEIEMWK